MIKKIIIPLLILFTTFLVQGQITLTTTSNSGSWSPSVVTKTGADLVWEATNSVIGTVSPVSQVGSDPVFDFSGNDGTPIDITVTSSDGFGGLTYLNLNGSVADNINDINVSQAINLNILYMRYSDLSTIDISANPVLQFLDLRNGDLQIAELDQIVNDLDANGVTNGNLLLNGNPGHLSYNSHTAYNSLIVKGWTIDATAPPSGPNTETIMLTTTSNQAIWTLGRFNNTGLTLHWKAEGTGITTQEFDDNKPVFDFSSNVSNDPITITVTSEDGFDYLTEMSLYIDDPNSSNPNGTIPSDITDVELSNANTLEHLYPFRSNLGDIDVSQNIALERLLIHGANKQLDNQLGNLLDISNNSNLFFIRVENTYIQTLSSLISNPLIRDIDLRNSEFTSAALDQVLIDLDANGITNPPPAQYNENIEILGNPGVLTIASIDAYNSLLAKGWTIDVFPHPASSGPEIDVLGGAPLVSIVGDGSNIVNTADNTDFGSAILATPIVRSFTIQNTGDGLLNLTGASIVSISGANASDFTVSSAPATPISVGASTTFEITFDASASGVGIKNAIITIENDALSGPLLYTFNIEAEAKNLAVGPEIEVSGNGVVIPNNNTPIVADDTDFGEVAIGSSITKTFTIQNVGDSDLTVTSSGLYQPGGGSIGDYFSTGNIGPPVGLPQVIVLSGSSIDMTVTFSPNSTGPQSVTLYVSSDDTDESLYNINITAEGISAPSGEMEVEGNGITIESGNFTPEVPNGTDFGDVIIGSSVTQTFTINNTGAGDLDVDTIVIPGSSTYIVSNIALPTVMSGGASLTFDVIFSPTTVGVDNNIIQIANSGSIALYQFGITANAVPVPPIEEIMFTQFYSGSAGSDNWIEIKNISGAVIPAGTYNLAYYNRADAHSVNAIAPTLFEIIPEMAVEEVLVYRNSTAVKPSVANLGSATQINTVICASFDGNGEIFLLTTSVNASSYANRVDLLGNTTNWGEKEAYIKGGCASEAPQLFFDKNDWNNISLESIDAADPFANIAIGTQVVGPTEFNGSVWTNGVGDISRTVTLTASFTNASQTIAACNLTVATGVDIVFDSNGITANSIILAGDLIVDGTLTIGDTESLVTLGDNPSLGIITKIEKSTLLANIHDNTYWSSPVDNAVLETVFAGVNPSRIFQYNTGAVNPVYAGTVYEHWFLAEGSMAVGRGYAIEGASTGVQTINFVGKPNTGTISLNATYSGSPDVGAENNNFNLLGNPYPTAINMNSFFSNTKVNQIALWTHSTPISGGDSGEFITNDYIYYNLGGASVPTGTVTNNIGSGQGFMARVETGGVGGDPVNTTVSFNDGMKLIGQNTQFFKGSKSKKNVIAEVQKDRMWLMLKNENGAKSNIMVGFFAKATDGIDSYYDSYGFDSDKEIGIYSQVLGSESKLLIQGLSAFTEDKKVPLGFATQKANKLSIKMLQAEGALKDAEIYLVDHLLNVTHNLKEGDYTFEQTVTGEFPNRFTLQFAGQALDVDDDIFTKNEFVISNDVESLNIRSAKEVKDIKVYDLLGRMLINQKPNKKSFNLSTGSIKNGTVLVIKATLENGTVISKKTIKY